MGFFFWWILAVFDMWALVKFTYKFVSEALEIEKT
jgi:hypothetical protein